MDIQEQKKRTIIFLEELGPDCLPYAFNDKVFKSAEEYVEGVLQCCRDFFKSVGDDKPLTEIETAMALRLAKGAMLTVIFQKVLAKFSAFVVPVSQMDDPSLFPPIDKDKLN